MVKTDAYMRIDEVNKIQTAENFDFQSVRKADAFHGAYTPFRPFSHTP
jgi:hypothetical protein